MIDSDSKQQTSKELIQNLLNNLAGSGIKLEPESFISKAKGLIKDEHDLMFQAKENSSDSISVSGASQRISAAKKLGKQNHNGHGKDGQNEAQKITGTLKEYSESFVQLVISGGSDIKKKVDRLESQLKSYGLSENDLLNLRQNILKGIRGQLADNIKEKLMKRFFSKEKSIEWFINDREADQTIKTIFFSDKLGGADFGGHKGSLKGTVDQAMQEVKDEAKDFVNEELKARLTGKHLGDQSADKDIKKLLETGLKAGLDPQEFLKNWKKTSNDIGMVPVPMEHYFYTNTSGSNMQQGQQQGQRGFEFSKDDEKELLINQLRALYMKRAVNDSLNTTIETAFKIRKLKNGLIKLGVTFGDLQNIEKEGQAIGRMKLLEMLKEAFYERATLYELSGPAHRVVETKIKGTLKNLDRLGMDLSKDEVNAIRDQANFAMFDTARIELERSIILYETRLKAGFKQPSLHKKIMQMAKLLKRIQQESKIVSEFDPEAKVASMNVRGTKT